LSHPKNQFLRELVGNSSKIPSQDHAKLCGTFPTGTCKFLWIFFPKNLVENFYLSTLTRILGVSVWINFRGNFPYQFLQEFWGFQHELMFRNIFPINSHKNLRGFSIEINFKKLRNLKIFKS